MYNTPQEFIADLNKVPNGRNYYKVLYGKIADIIPIKATIREIAEASWEADKNRLTKRVETLKELKAPEVIIANDQKRLDICVDFETWLKKSKIGSAFRNIWGKKNML